MVEANSEMRGNKGVQISIAELPQIKSDYYQKDTGKLRSSKNKFSDKNFQL